MMNLAPFADLIRNLRDDGQPHLTPWQISRSPDWSVFAEDVAFSLGRLTGGQVFDPNRWHVRSAEWSNWLQVGPAGSGKTARLQIPLLLEHPNSAFVIDRDAERYTVTSPRRGQGNGLVTESMGGRVVAFDPTGLLGPTNNHAVDFNPLAGLNPEDPRVVAQIECIVHAVVPEIQNDMHRTQAGEIVEAFIAHELLTKERPSLVDLYDVMKTDALRTFMTKVKDMDSLRSSHALYWTLEKVKNAAKAFLIMGDRESSAIEVSLLHRLKWVDGMRDHLSGPGFDLACLSDPKGMTTIYLVMPVNEFKANQPYMQMVSNLVIESLLAKSDRRTEPSLMLLDHLTDLGEIWQLPDLLSRSYAEKVKVCMAIHSINDFQDVYRQACDALIGECNLMTFQHYFGPNATFLARYLGCRMSKLPRCAKDEMMAVYRGSPVFLEMLPYWERFGQNQYQANLFEERFRPDRPYVA